MIRTIEKCRICGNANLVPILDLGEQALTGVFPRSTKDTVTAGPMSLVKCCDSKNGEACGLLQLKQSYELDEMYGENYGYRSGLNKSMVSHLQSKIRQICGIADLKKGDLVIDIGSNDSTLLQAYPSDKGLNLVGIDPTGKKFKEYYPDHVKLIPDFFSSKAVKENFGDKKAKVVTSIAMFYDLESPIGFMQEIYDVLDNDGVWVFEQSYMPTMLAKTSYDTICHEHLEYYTLKQIKWMADKVGFKIIGLEFNDVNGGSFSIMVSKRESKLYQEETGLIEDVLREERETGLDTLKPFEEFREKIYKHKNDLLDFLDEARSNGEKVFGYGASTKGNVILQLCGLSKENIPCIAEVNKDKFGAFTPGTHIPIVSEADARAENPEYFLVLPWHFRDGIVEREQDFLKDGGKLVFPLPKIEIVTYKESPKSHKAGTE